MTNTMPSLLVAVSDHSAVVKVVGRANFTTSVSFKRLVGELRHRGFHNFLLDLSECVTMDSTFLGVLAGTAIRLSDPVTSESAISPATAAPVASRLKLLNPNQRVSDLLDNLGISDLFETLQCDGPAPATMVTAPTASPSRQELSQTCLDAHRLLMDLNPENVTKFRDVTQFLAEDLRKMTGETPDSNGNGSSLAPESSS